MSIEFRTYDYKSAGKLIGITKTKHLWKLQVDGRNFEIKLAESFISSKFVVAVQNDIILKQKVDSSAKKKGISISYQNLNLLFKSAQKGMDLFVNMVKFVPNSGKSKNEMNSGMSVNNSNRRVYEEREKNQRKEETKGSWEKFDDLTDSDDEENPFENFENKQQKQSKMLESKSLNANQKVEIKVKQVEKKSLTLKFKGGNSKASDLNTSVIKSSNSPNMWGLSQNQSELWSQMPNSDANRTIDHSNSLKMSSSKSPVDLAERTSPKMVFTFDQSTPSNHFGVNSVPKQSENSPFDAFKSASPVSSNNSKVFTFQQGSGGVKTKDGSAQNERMTVSQNQTVSLFQESMGIRSAQSNNKTVFDTAGFPTHQSTVNKNESQLNMWNSFQIQSRDKQPNSINDPDLIRQQSNNEKYKILDRSEKPMNIEVENDALNAKTTRKPTDWQFSFEGQNKFSEAIAKNETVNVKANSNIKYKNASNSPSKTGDKLSVDRNPFDSMEMNRDEEYEKVNSECKKEEREKNMSEDKGEKKAYGAEDIVKNFEELKEEFNSMDFEKPKQSNN